jgi:predicted neuraminidase
MAQRYEGRWSAPALAAKVANLPHWNPVLFRAPNGWVHLYFKVGAVPHKWITWVVTSKDEGATWTDPEELAPGVAPTPGPSKNQPIAFADGTWLAPNSQGVDGRWDVFVDRSADGGATWQRGPIIALDHATFPGRGAIQPTLWESDPGCVHMLVRTTEGRIWRGDSADGGVSWAPLYAIDLPNNNSGIDLAKLHDGTLALVYNPISEREARTPLRVALSFDNGATWPHWLDIESDDGEYSYPTVVPTTKGLAITYTWKRERVAFWHGSIEQITMKDVGLTML